MDANLFKGFKLEHFRVLVYLLEKYPKGLNSRWKCISTALSKVTGECFDEMKVKDLVK